MTFSSIILIKEIITKNAVSKRTNLIRIEGNFMQGSSDTGGDVDLGRTTVSRFPEITVNAAKDHHATMSSSIMSIVTATGVTSGSFSIVMVNT